ncbi:MAG TPA: MotA/TolQ/ExbB proton channel family protein [Rhizobacter sp.]|jgi:biopolymer transport protein ExbB|nr:MotA/TolQ/ExbB proton channel family protein [Rhizobacter sp.]
MSFIKKINSFAAGLLVIASLALTSAHAQAPASAPEAAAPAAVATPASVAPPAATVSKEVVENPYDLKHLWAQGDVVARGTLIILIIMSLASWYILVTKLFESFKLSSEAKAARQTFFKSASLADGMKTLKAGSAFQFIAESGVEAGKDHAGELTANIDRNTWIGMSVQRAIENVQSRLQDGLAVLATVGSTAPFVGLFGTVWGILNALTAIGIAGQASIDKVAGPVGESLLMTAIGLAVAVPAVLGYNWLVRRNKVTMESVRSFGADLHGVLLGSRAAVR